MGCSSTREKLESKMLMLNMRKADIQQEREEHLANLTKMTRLQVTREPVKDYLIIPKLCAKENKNLKQLLSNKISILKNNNSKHTKKNTRNIKNTEKSTSDFTYVSKKNSNNKKFKEEESQSNEEDSESEDNDNNNNNRNNKVKFNKRKHVVIYKNKFNKNKKVPSDSSEEINEESSYDSYHNQSDESYEDY